MISVFLFISIVSSAQEGGLFLTNFQESRQAEDQNWAICQDSRDIMLFANRRGVAIFDGYSWELKRLPVIPYSMVYNNDDERVYLGGEDEYGFLARNDRGIYEYNHIETDSSFSGIVTGIVFTDTTLWVLTSNCIVGHSAETFEITHLIHAHKDAPFSSIFASPAGVFVSLYSSGLFRLAGETLVTLITGYMTAQDDILFTLPYDSRKVMIGLASGTIQLFDGLEFFLWEPEDEGYISDNQLAGGHIANDSLLLFSTIEGGVAVVGKKDKRLHHIINYETGLPDNEVYAVGSDNNLGLWISHEFGLTRADLTLPVRNFGIYPGLNGNIISSLWHEGNLYVGTSDGLFVLREIKEYRNVDVLERVRSSRRAAAKVSRPAENTLSSGAGSGSGQEQEQEQEQEVTVIQRHRSVFDRIFGKKDVNKPVEKDKPADVIKDKPVALEMEREKPFVTDIQLRPDYVYVRRTESVVHSVYYEYKKIPGIDEKCRQLVSTSHGILAATSMGLYSITRDNAIAVETDRYINRIGTVMADGSHLVVTNNGCFSVAFRGSKWKVTESDVDDNRAFFSGVTDDDNNLWLGAENCIVRIKADNAGGPEILEYSVPNEYLQRYHVEYVRDTLFVLNSSGIYFFDKVSEDLVFLKRFQKYERQPFTYILTENGSPWIVQDQIIEFFGDDSDWTARKESLLRLFDGITSITSAINAVWITDASDRIFRIDTDPSKNLSLDLDLYIGRFSDNDEPFFDVEIAEFERGHREVNFRFISPYYSNQKSVQYSYLLSADAEEWSEWSSDPSFTKFLKPGHYTLRAISRAAVGTTSDERTLQFRIRPRFIETTGFYVILFLVFSTVIYIIVKMREGKLLHDKKILEDRVLERTAEIEAQKKEITSSIEYASRIQHAMLPAETVLHDAFSDHFILYRPRNIVSGDFYWISREDERVFITAADCTGHGVPGAFMSMLGISAINDIINSDATLTAAEVLERLRDRIIKSLKQTGRQGEAADGIDMAFCIFDRKTSLIEFAGAYNSLVHFRKSKITEYRGNRMPIGIYHGESERFSYRIVKLDKGDTLYLFTDGFADQFGGPAQTKYKTKNLKLLLSSIKDLPMSDQMMMLNEEFDRWRGTGEQTDDITIIGIRI